MGFWERYPTERKEETPEEMERTVHDSGSATGGTLLQTKNWATCAFEIIKTQNTSTEDWCIPENMEEGDYLIMDPACEVKKKAPGKRTMRMKYWKKKQARHWNWIIMKN